MTEAVSWKEMAALEGGFTVLYTGEIPPPLKPWPPEAPPANLQEFPDPVLAEDCLYKHHKWPE